MRAPEGFRPCLLLEGAAHREGEDILLQWDSQSSLWDHFFGDSLTDNWSSHRSLFDNVTAAAEAGDRVPAMALARRCLIEAVSSSDIDQKAIQRLILQSVRLYRLACPLDSAAEQDRLAHNGEPAFLARLNEKRWSDVLEAVEASWRREQGRGDQRDWDDPALLLAGESLVYLLSGGELVQTADPVETWVLLESGTEITRHGSTRTIPDGLLARLVIEKVPGGSGLLYPDCRFSGYLPLEADFQQGLRNVMTVLRRRSDWLQNGGFECDFRWRMIPLSPEDGHELPVLLRSVRGRSAEVAFACGVRAALLEERLDTRMAVTACFHEPGAPHERLYHVEGIVEKLLGLREELPDERGDPGLKAHFVDRILQYGEGQPEQQHSIYNWLVRMAWVRTFDVAYRELSHYCRTTDRVKRHRAKRAAELLQVTCTPYVRSSLSTRRPGNPQQNEPPEVPVPLTGEEVEQIIRGNPGRHRRTRLLAESGLGKSTLLIEAEQLIASARDNRVPLRLGAGPASCSRDDLGRWNRLPLLSDFDWSRNRADLLEELGERLLGDVVEDRQERSRWIRTAVSRGDVVFLLDSLDQTDRSLKFDGFLNSDGVRGCSVLLSARPETRRTKSSSYAGIEWQTLWVDPFDEDRIRQFWGNAPLLNELLRNDDWQPLREIPVLLQQMKRLAENGWLAGLTNREALYHCTLEMLLDHGHRGMGDAGQQAAAQEDLATVERRLSGIAWQTIMQESTAADGRSGSFTGELGGEAYAAFSEQHREDLHQLDQLNLTTRQTYVDQFGIRQSRFAWRHLSFCEWFAGLHLAACSAEEQENVIRQHALDERWHWIFRFALSAAHRQNKPEVVARLARWLLKYGAAFLLWTTIDPGRDGVPVPEKLDTLCRWLVHRDRASWKPPFDRSTSPWIESQDDARPVVDDEVVDILNGMFAVDDEWCPRNRDSRWLHPAWQLVVENLPVTDTAGEHPTTVQNKLQDIHDRFLSEFEQRVNRAADRNRGRLKAAWQREDAGLLQLVPDEHLARLGLISAKELARIRHWPDPQSGTYEERRDRFNAQLKNQQANFCQCPPVGWEHPYRDDDGQPRDPSECLIYKGTGHRVHRLPEGYQLQRTPVTNLQFEAFDPNHRSYRYMQWRRDDETEENALNSHPVVEVSWLQARMICVWLTGWGAFGTFSLPFDFDWEACARAGRDFEPKSVFEIPRLRFLKLRILQILARWAGQNWSPPINGFPHTGTIRPDRFGIPLCDERLQPVLDEAGEEQFDSLSSHGANFYDTHRHNDAECGPYRRGTISVGQFAGNGFGLFDMHGQVREWMQNEYGSDERDQSELFVPADSRRSLRGGSWFCVGTFTGCNDRRVEDACIRKYFTGVRLAWTD